MVTASKVLSAKGSFIPSPATLGTSRSVPAASIPREKSHATHHAPDLDSSTVDTAVPAARSSTFSPGCRFKRLRVSLRHRRRSEEHTSELQSRGHLVCRLLLEKKKHDK